RRASRTRAAMEGTANRRSLFCFASEAAGSAMSELTIATIIFVVTYAVIISERLERAVVALAGAGLMIAFGVLNQHQALESIDPNTLALLVGMMIIVGILKRTGVFRYVGWQTATVL